MNPSNIKIWCVAALLALVAFATQAQDVVIRRNTTTTTTSTTTVSKPRKPQDRVVSRPTTGTLSISSTPSGAVVKIGGNYMGETPLTLGKQDPGTYSVTFSAEGYDSQSISVTVKAGKTASCNATLKKKQTPQPVVTQPLTTTTTATPSSATTQTQPPVVMPPSKNTNTTNTSSSAATQTFTVNGVSFNMIRVEGGTFTMGATSEQGRDAEKDEKPTHRVTLSAYYIGETEVTQALWEAVMGNNPSYFKGVNRPVEEVSWDDCKRFISKLNSITGKNFRLPTEAEWEYAARGGSKSNGYKYSGSNSLGDVACYSDISGGETHAVKTKLPNELGIYDMSGNVCEWCNDWKGSYCSSAQTNPTGPATGSLRVSRGGCWFLSARYCRVAYRDGSSPMIALSYFGLRLALSDSTASSQSPSMITTPSTETSTPNQSYQIINVNDVSFKMIRVEGGTFTMGATSEQGRDAEKDEKPTHHVTLSAYYIGETEVTQALWEAVMGNNPSHFKGANRPVEEVSWDDCKRFISKLNSITGKNFRLPTEAEWEYAARGGNKSYGYKYSGSNSIVDVALYDDNSGKETHAVKLKLPNELGIYDMSGNVGEWCSDWYDKNYYLNSPNTNPNGTSMGSYRVNRGGGWADNARCCRVSRRSSNASSNAYNDLGFRLAL